MAGPPPVVARARRAVRGALLERLTLLADATDASGLQGRVLVGLSGGPDSLALCATTCWVAGRMGLETEVGIVDHGLQEDSSRVAGRARAQAERLGASAVHVLPVQVDPELPGGIENAARVARAEALDALAEERGAVALLLGHTLDDQAEQVLMGLARGAGARALSGIPPVRGRVLRPFLGIGRDEATALAREDTEEICTVLDLDPWQDPMNADLHLLRGRVRHRVMPLLAQELGPQIVENLARTAALVGPDTELLDAEAGDTLRALTRSSQGPDDLLVLDVHALAALPAPIRTRILRDASRQAESSGGTPSDKSLLRRHVLAADALVVSWHGQAAVTLPGRIEVARRDGLLIWRRSAP
jgi:tRNA(Ile)-lysidine synthase